MNLAPKDVEPIENYNLILTYENGEKRRFDMNPFLSKGIFKELKDITKFNAVKLSHDAVVWDNEADIEHKVLYKYSKAI